MKYSQRKFSLYAINSLRVFIFFLVFFIGVNAQFLYAYDGPSPFKGVKFYLNNGELIEGYIRASQVEESRRAQFIYRDVIIDGEIQFSGNYIKCFQNLREIEWNSIETIYSSSYESTRKQIKDAAILISVGGPVVVKVDSILSYEIVAAPLDGLVTRDLHVVSEKTASIFSKPPFGYVHCGNESDSYLWLSYNQYVKGDDLVLLCESPWFLIIRASKDLEQRRIFGFRIYWD